LGSSRKYYSLNFLDKDIELSPSNARTSALWLYHSCYELKAHKIMVRPFFQGCLETSARAVPAMKFEKALELPAAEESALFFAYLFRNFYGAGRRAQSTASNGRGRSGWRPKGPYRSPAKGISAMSRNERCLACNLKLGATIRGVVHYKRIDKL